MGTATKENEELFASIENAITATKEAESDELSAEALEANHREYYSKRGVSDFRTRIAGDNEVDFFEMLDSVSDGSKIPVARTMLNRMGSKDCEVASTAKDGWAWANSWAWANAWIAVNGAIAANAGVLANVVVVGTEGEDANRRSVIDRAGITLSDNYRNSTAYSALSGKGYSEVRQEALLKGMLSGRIPGTKIVSEDNGTLHVESSYADCDISFDVAPSEDGKTLQLL